MTRTLTTLALCSTLFAGCWPYLPGPYEDYVDGGTDEDTDPVQEGEAALVGDLQVFTLRGDYWGDGSSDGDPLGGSAVLYLTEDERTDVFQRWTGGVGRCRPRDAVVEGFNNEGEALNDPEELRMVGDSVIRLPWLDESRLWGVSLSENTRIDSRDEFALGDAETDEYGTLGTDDLFTFPRQLSVTSPNISGASVATVSRSSVTVEWTGQSAGVFVRFIPRDNEGNELDDIICSVDGDSRSLTVTASEVPSLSQAGILVLVVGNVTRGSGSVGDGVANQAAAIDWQQGAVFLE